MNPIALDLGFVAVRWYSVMAFAGMSSSIVAGRYWAGRYGLDADRFLNLSVLLVPAVILGGRVGYVLANLGYYRRFPEEILRVDHGGFGSHGAIVAVLVVGYIAVRRMDMPFWTSADALAPALPLSYFFVRLGNFANGELYGMATGLPWGIVFPGVPGPRHPSMLYEAVGEAAILILALHWCGSRSVPGHAFLRTGLWMAVLRVLVDFTRSGLGGPVFGLAVTQILSIGMGTACVIAMRTRTATGEHGKECHNYVSGA